MQVCLDGLWGSVCDGGNLDFTNAAVVCRQLNYNGYTAQVEKSFLQNEGRYRDGSELQK